jgi:hypothetical protein
MSVGAAQCATAQWATEQNVRFGVPMAASRRAAMPVQIGGAARKAG